MTRDRQTIIIGIEHGEWQSLISYQWHGSGWGSPDEIIGNPEYPAHDPYLSLDEQRLFFITRARGNADIAFLSRSSHGEWQKPTLLNAPVNSPSNEYYTSMTTDGDIVFASDRSMVQPGDYDIYRASLDAGSFSEPARFPEGINTDGYEADPFIDPDGRFLVFASNRRGGHGRGDLYLSIAEESGGWSDPIPFDDTINNAGHQLCPLVTLDGSALLFTSDQDIYWVSASVIDRMVSSYLAQSGQR